MRYLIEPIYVPNQMNTMYPKLFSIGLLLLVQTSVIAQKIEVDSILLKPGVEVLNSGFIDLLNNGQVSAAARFVRLQIGEPHKFHIPLSIYGGISNQAFNNNAMYYGEQQGQQLLEGLLINPLAGLINFSVENIRLRKQAKPNVTKIGYLYQVGTRVLTGYFQSTNSYTGSLIPFNFLNNYVAVGGYFQTGAWEKSRDGNMGVCWFALRYIQSISSKNSIQKLVDNVAKNSRMQGCAFGMGVEINQLLHVKAVVYQYLKGLLPGSNPTLYQVTFHYSLKTNS